MVLKAHSFRLASGKPGYTGGRHHKHTQLEHHMHQSPFNNMLTVFLFAITSVLLWQDTAENQRSTVNLCFMYHICGILHLTQRVHFIHICPTYCISSVTCQFVFPKIPVKKWM